VLVAMADAVHLVDCSPTIRGDRQLTTTAMSLTPHYRALFNWRPTKFIAGAPA